MKQFGRHRRQFFRIVAIDKSKARDGDVLEVLGTYDPALKDKESRVILRPARIKHWISKGAKASSHVAIFLKKYMEKFEKAEAQPTG
ncbi:MAG: 30S ribosomal protein S16 [Gemmataceae bacterium]|nr:30S ribosomal protein S16 [Gemmataceae bacterium]